MRDVLELQAPLGLLGRLAEVIFLERYLTDLLARRNAMVEQEAERKV